MGSLLSSSHPPAPITAFDAPVLASITGRSMLSHGTILGGRGGRTDCAMLVKPVDPSPLRSPQAVHTVLAQRFIGKDVVEVGTHHGDGMNCFARTARSAIAIEIDKSACGLLRARAQKLKQAGLGTYGVMCDFFPAHTPDADIFTWWREAPHLSNERALKELRERQLTGQVRAGAIAYVLFDHGFGSDAKSWKRLRALASWHTRVPFDEYSQCMRMMPAHKSDSSYGNLTNRVCHRARGSFTVAEIPIAHVDPNKMDLLAP